MITQLCLAFFRRVCTLIFNLLSSYCWMDGEVKKNTFRMLRYWRLQRAGAKWKAACFSYEQYGILSDKLPLKLSALKWSDKIHESETSQTDMWKHDLMTETTGRGQLVGYYNSPVTGKKMMTGNRSKNQQIVKLWGHMSVWGVFIYRGFILPTHFNIYNKQHTHCW